MKGGYLNDSHPKPFINHEMDHKFQSQEWARKAKEVLEENHQA
jgi:hypothetical protein